MLPDILDLFQSPTKEDPMDIVYIALIAVFAVAAAGLAGACARLGGEP